MSDLIGLAKLMARWIGEPQTLTRTEVLAIYTACEKRLHRADEHEQQTFGAIKGDAADGGE